MPSGYNLGADKTFGGGSMSIDPSWITAGSQVLGAALAPSPAGPSRADGRSDTGGFFDFGAPFNVTTGSGDASLSPAGSGAAIAIAAGIVIAGMVAWKLWRKKS